MDIVTIRGAAEDDLPAIKRLLSVAGLTVSGIEEVLASVFVAMRTGELIGVVGMERCGDELGLLRSLAVAHAHRQRGTGRHLVERVVSHARLTGLTGLYLLTTTAREYFADLGFVVVARDELPEAIRDTRQYRELCPDSAVPMFRPLDHTLSAGPRTAREVFDSGLYCAESVLVALAKHNGIDSPLIPAIATGFCSGVSRTSGMCGALTGGILGLNLVYGRDRTQESVEQNYAVVQQLVTRFVAACGTTQCSELLNCDLGAQEGQRQFREHRLHERCRAFTTLATELAMALCDKPEAGK